MSAFYWGYIVSHVPGGLLSAKIGGKHAISVGMFIALIFSIITPKAIELGMRSYYEIENWINSAKPNQLNCNFGK